MTTTEKENKPITQTTDVVTSLAPTWPYRALGAFLVLFVIFIISATILTLKNDLVAKRIEVFKIDIIKKSSQYGFKIDDIIISGRDRTSKEEILKVVNLSRENNILEADLYDIKTKVEKLPWVKNACVSRSFFPNVLHINIEERKVSSIWQISEKFYPIDFDGNVINAEFRSQEPILLIVGAGAPENVKTLLDGINDKDGTYYNRIKVANFISKRRWNLILDDIKDGITIKLPETDVDKAWKKLLKLNETKGILKRKLTIIDLRLPDKVVVKLKKTSASQEIELNKQKESKI